MDFASITAIVIAAAIIYFIIKFIVNPLVKAAVGVIILLILVYALQQYFNLDIIKVLGNFFGFKNWSSEPINNFVNQIKIWHLEK